MPGSSGLLAPECSVKSQPACPSRTCDRHGSQIRASATCIRAIHFSGYLALVSRKYKIHDQEDLHFLSYAVVGWVDALSRPVYKDVVVQSLAFCQKEKGLQLFAWCIMSNHVHLIAKAAPGGKLQDIMRDHKKFTAKKIVEAIEQNAQESRSEWMLPLLKDKEGAIRFWQHDLHPIWLRSPAVIEQKLEYIHMNPVKAGLVTEAHHYIYSSATAYAGLPTLLAVEVL